MIYFDRKESIGRLLFLERFNSLSVSELQFDVCFRETSCSCSEIKLVSKSHCE